MTTSSEEHAGRIREMVQRLEALTSPICLGYQNGPEESRVFASAYITFGLKLAGFYLGCITPEADRARVFKAAIEMLTRTVETFGASVDAIAGNRPPAVPKTNAPVPTEPASTPEEHAVAERDMLELQAKVQGKGDQHADE